MTFLKHAIFVLFLNLSINIIAQSNYDYINIQGQFLNNQSNNTADIDIYLFNILEDTIFHEQHTATSFYNNSTFSFALGSGIFINGSISQLSLIDWINVSEVKIINHGNSEKALFNFATLPYTLHSLYTIQPPKLDSLTDVQSSHTIQNGVLKFNGLYFYETTDLVGDTALFSWTSNSTIYSDTAQIFIHTFSDSSLFTFLSDTSNYSNSSNHSIYSDSSIYVTSIDTISYSISNWSLTGNTNTSIQKYIGTTDSQPFSLRTNSLNRLTFNPDFSVSNTTPTNGFNWALNNSFLATISSPIPPLNSIQTNHFYYSSNKKATHGGNDIQNLDTLLGMYSFSWGENVGTNGANGVVFGKNTFGDSAFIFGTTYDAISSFAVGRNCTTTYVGVAIGDNADAVFYRNVAIGKNVQAGRYAPLGHLSSAAIGIGNNVKSLGATAIAFGHNTTASGLFSTSLGVNSSTNNFKGSFVYGDFSTSDTVFNTQIHQFMVRSNGGVFLYTSTDLTMGVSLATGDGSWNMISDKTKKKNINTIVYHDYAENFKNTTVSLWNYKGQQTEHIGPMAQTFNKNFNFNEQENYINMLDIDGATLLGIKDIHLKTLKLDKSESLKVIQSDIKTELDKINEIEQRIKLLYEKTNN